jgi:pyruvate kinase
MDIVTTIGPASWDRTIVGVFLQHGVRCIRFPFSKLRPDVHVANCAMVRDVARGLGLPVLAMADLPGGKPRLNSAGPLSVEPARAYWIARQQAGAAGSDFWLEPELLGYRIKAGDAFVIGDGENRFVVSDVAEDHVLGRFTRAGVIEWQRAFMPEGTPLKIPSLTDRDRAFAREAHAARFDWLALSYVDSSDDVAAARAWLHDELGWQPYIVAKLETATAVANVEAIARTADAVMIARGDLAVEIGFEQLWSAQKTIVEACRRSGTYCIAATGFLEHLLTEPAATRAECMDFCAALEMGVDAIMFSTETSIGKHPVKVVETAVRLAESWQHSSAPALSARPA